MNLFYTDPASVSGSRLTLTGQEALHAGTVLRFRSGDPILVTDGLGNRFQGNVHSAGRSELVVSIGSREYVGKQEPEITVAIGLIKKRDRLEFAVEKAVELGVSKIVLFRGDQSEKTGVKMDRLQATVLSAMKQSLRCWLPEILFCDNLSDALNVRGEAHLLVADETLKPDGTVRDRVPAGQLFVVVGPEGGFSGSEQSLMTNAGAIRMTLGPCRLRTETAVVALVSRLTLPEI